MLLRLDDRVSCTRLVSKSIALSHLIYVCRSIDTIDYLQRLFCIDYLYLSESVYHSYALVDFAIKNSITVPYFLTYEAPLFIRESHSCNVSDVGPSPRQKATLDVLSSSSQPDINILRQSISSRVRGSSSYNEVYSKNIDLIDSYSRKALDNLDSPYVSADDNISNFLLKNNSIVLYMHAATDGMYLRGFSGFPTPIDFFIDSVTKLLHSLNGDLNVIVKPHPNLLMGITSAYKSHHDKADKELLILRFHLQELFSTVRELGGTPILISSNTNLESCFALPCSYHTSHHGTVLSDAYIFGQKLSAPLCHLLLRFQIHEIVYSLNRILLLMTFGY